MRIPIFLNTGTLSVTKQRQKSKTLSDTVRSFGRDVPIQISQIKKRWKKQHNNNRQ